MYKLILFIVPLLMLSCSIDENGCDNFYSSILSKKIVPRIVNVSEIPDTIDNWILKLSLFKWHKYEIPDNQTEKLFSKFKGHKRYQKKIVSNWKDELPENYFERDPNYGLFIISMPYFNPTCDTAVFTTRHIKTEYPGVMIYICVYSNNEWKIVHKEPLL